MRVFFLLVLIFGLFATAGCDMMTEDSGCDKVTSQNTKERLISFFEAKYSARLPVDTKVELGDFEKSSAKGLCQGSFIVSMPERGEFPVSFLTDKNKRYLVLSMAEVVDLNKFQKAEISRFKKGEIRLPRQQPLPILVSNDGSQLIVGDIFDSTIDPLQEVLSKISLENVPLKGPREAKITVVEYSDFQCPYCKQASDMLPALTKKYKDKIKVVFKQFPLPNHDWAKPASVASLCAYEQGNDKFWKVHDLIFKHQKEITLENSNDKFKKFAKQSGLNSDKFSKCLKSDAVAKRVDQEIDEGNQIGVRSTPTFIVDGIIVSGASLDAVENAIDSRL